MTPRLLVFTRTTGFRHESIPEATAAVREWGSDHGFAVDATEDPAVLSTSGEVLTGRGRTALRDYVEAGGGFVGVHSAACTEYEWPYYGELLGARFADHPA